MSASWSGEQPDFPGPSTSDLAKAKEIMAGEGPVIAEPPDTAITLFRGIWDGARFRSDATVKELTGADEEGIARMMGASAPAQYMNAVLAYGVSQLGNYELEKMTVQERMGIIDMLLVGEKEYLFLQILRVTYGDERTVSVQCQSCFSMNEVFFSISDDIPIKKLDEPSRTLYDYETKGGQRVEYRLVCGADAAEAQKRPNISGPEENTVILARIIETVDGQPLVDATKFVRNLGAMDRRTMMRDVVSHQPGPYFEEVKLPCATCGAESLFTPSWGDLL